MITIELSSIDIVTLSKSIRLSLYIMQDASQNDAEAEKLRAVRLKINEALEKLTTPN